MTTPQFRLDGVTAGYGRTTVLRDVTFEVPAGSVVAMLGANGAGKTTTLRGASGLIRPQNGTVTLGDRDVTKLSASKRAEAGLCLIPEGRGIFRSLTVAENLRLQRPIWVKDDALVQTVYGAFPILEERRNQVAGSLSGGQQQMLALARAWLSAPSVVLLDEVSLGLAPTVVDTIFKVLQQLADSGTTLLLVEQFVSRALALADYVLLLDRGSVAYFGPAGELDEEKIKQTYLGLRGTCEKLLCVGLVARVDGLQGIVLFCVGLVSWCCGNMRPVLRPAWSVACTMLTAELYGDTSSGGEPYNEVMTRSVTTIEERITLLESAPRATSDEATTLVDGRRLDSREAVVAWLAEDTLARQAEVPR